MWNNNKICELLEIKHPIIQGGMVYNSGSELVSAVSEAGGLGLLGSGSMRPEELRTAIREVKSITNKPFGVNLPLLFKQAAESLEVALEEDVKIFFTSAGSPKRVVNKLKEAGCTMVHVVASPQLAKKCEDAGCDAIVCEGFEAGGHNGREELTSLVLTQLCVDAVSIPVISAGGIATGSQMAAMLALGASGVQIGSRFAVTQESSGHLNYKQAVVEGIDTQLVLKKHIPVRLLKNEFRDEIIEAELTGADREKLQQILGSGRARSGMFDGDIIAGELEIGQVAAQINDIPKVSEVFDRLLVDYKLAAKRLGA
jgi:enoyl-[acyl-carrier protein] reductase II